MPMIRALYGPNPNLCGSGERVLCRAPTLAVARTALAR